MAPGIPWEWFAVALLIVAFGFALWGFYSREKSAKPGLPPRVAEPANIPSAEAPVVAQTAASEAAPPASAPAVPAGSASAASMSASAAPAPPSLEPAMPRPGPRTQKLPPESALPRLREPSWSRSRHERTPGSPSAPTGGRSCKTPSTRRRKSRLELATGLSLRPGMQAPSISHSTARSCQPRALPTRLRPSLLIPAVRSSSFASAHIADVS